MHFVDELGSLIEKERMPREHPFLNLSKLHSQARRMSSTKMSILISRLAFILLLWILWYSAQLSVVILITLAIFGAIQKLMVGRISRLAAGQNDIPVVKIAPLQLPSLLPSPRLSIEFLPQTMASWADSRRILCNCVTVYERED